MVLQKAKDYLRTTRRIIVGGLFLLSASAVMAAETPHKVILLTECGTIAYVIDMQGNTIRKAPITYFEGHPEAIHELATILTDDSTSAVEIDIAEGLNRICA